MKVSKIIKDKSNKYKVIIDSDEYILYDDVLLKYSLGLKNEIDKSTLGELLSYNDFLTYYYMSLKYIQNRLRCEKEVRTYLSKKNVDKNIIDKVIKKLYKDSYLNDYVYIKSYINDCLNLSDKGPLKIKQELIKLDLDISLIEDTLDSIISKVDINKRIENIISKKIKLNKDKGSNYLKRKILFSLVNLGYNKEVILSVLNSISFSDSELIKKEREKAYNKYSKKYSGYELDLKVKSYLYRKGFNLGEYYEE
jgi:regulatory protein